MTTNVWTTYKGEKIPIEKLTHSHLSNIYWYSRISYKIYPMCRSVFRHQIKFALQQLNIRFKGHILDYSPLYKWEFENLKKANIVVNNQKIIKSQKIKESL
jgi:hypothetical protein